MAARYVYQGNGFWAYQYTISQITLTTAQQKAIDSGVTKEYLAAITSDIDSIKDNGYNELPTPSEEYRGRVVLLTEKRIWTVLLDGIKRCRRHLYIYFRFCNARNHDFGEMIECHTKD